MLTSMRKIVQKDSECVDDVIRDMWPDEGDYLCYRGVWYSVKLIESIAKRKFIYAVTLKIKI